MSLLTQASLIVTPNAYKEGKLYSVIPSDGAGDMSVVRATTATRVNSAGLLELVPYNLLTYSNTFTTNWTLLNATLTSGQSGYDSSTDAWKLQSTGSNNSQIDQSFTQSGTQTFSIYAKKGSANFLVISIFNGGFGWYNLSNGTLGTSGGTFVSRDIISVGNGWYRCTIVTSVSISGAAVYVADADSSTNAANGSNIFIQNSQLVEGSTALPYQKTETRLNIPRIDYSNGTCPSLLVEPQRTNLITYSSSFDSGSWGAIDTTITGNTTISPSGIQDAETMTITSSTSRIFQTLSLGSGTYTASIYVKSLSGTPTIQFRMVVDGSDITDSIPTTTDWVRHDFTFTAVTSVDFFVIRGVSGTGSVAIWGAQLEAGSYPTSYIPTTSASVTRNADVISKTGISSLIGQTEGTVFVDLYFTDSSISNLIQLYDGASDVMAIYTGGNVVFFDGSNGTAQWSISGSLPNGRHKLAIAYKANDIVAYIDGTLIGTDTSAAIPTTDQLYLNGNVAGSFIEKQYYNSVALWKTRLTDNQLEQLTGTGFNTYAEMANYYNYILQ